ncbi:MAG: hypothetical protein P8Y64_11030 [Gammaproteobacteria bacterium]|jgi:hypothetical protein
MTSRTGWTLFTIGALLSLLAMILGKWFMPEVQNMGPGGFAALKQTPAMGKLLLFSTLVPLGTGLGLLGVAMTAGAGRRLFVFAAVSGVVLMFLVPGVFGQQRSPLYFGLGGLFILALVFASWWYWARYRTGLPAELQRAADWQAVGYLCFALAAWNTCGVLAMPGFALFPEKMTAFGTEAFATAIAKVVMAFFVLGWLCTLIGLRRAASARSAAG